MGQAFSHLTEIRNLNSLLRQLPKTVRAETRILNEVTFPNSRGGMETLPIHGLILGTEDKMVKYFIFQIGGTVVLLYMKQLSFVIVMQNCGI